MPASTGRSAVVAAHAGRLESARRLADLGLKKPRVKLPPPARYRRRKSHRQRGGRPLRGVLGVADRLQDNGPLPEQIRDMDPDLAPAHLQGPAELINVNYFGESELTMTANRRLPHAARLPHQKCSSDKTSATIRQQIEDDAG